MMFTSWYWHSFFTLSGWTLSLHEYQQTIPTLWDTVRSFMHDYQLLIPKNNLLNFVSDDGGRTYNMCHFWSNFEIGSLDFFRSATYLRFFEYLDRKGGFFYERWVSTWNYVRLYKLGRICVDPWGLLWRKTRGAVLIDHIIALARTY